MLSESQYLKLCSACDAVLQAPDAGEECIAIPWLHVIREHPVFLEQYEALFTESRLNGPSPRDFYRFVIGRLITMLAAAVATVRNAFRSASARSLDVLFVSHLLNADSAGDDNDFYFADWPAELKRQGYSTAIALINHTTADPRTLNSWSDAAVPRTILAPTLTPLGELRLAARVGKESLRLRRLAARTHDIFSRRVLMRASAEALSPITSSVLRIAEQVRRLIAQGSPRALVITYEGHSWERILFATAKAVTPDIRAIAYQHALLFRHQHAALRPLNTPYDPSVVLTAGDLARDRFSRAFASRGIPVATAGSRRGDVLHAPLLPRPDKSVCLVVPEGIISECNLLFAFSLECARQAPHVRFVWRLHPIVGFEALVAANPALAHRPANVVLSSAPLEDDIAASEWVLYRGSTTVVSAAAAHVRPIYLRIPGEMTIDPLYGADRGVQRIERPEEAAVLFAQRESSSGSGREADAAYLASFCSRLFSPADFSKLRETLPLPRSALAGVTE